MGDINTVFDLVQIFFIIVGCLTTLALVLLVLKPVLFRKKQFFARPVITTFESKMFFQLKQAFPQYHVLAQVAFSALITSDQYKVRQQFNRKVTDFVILNEKLIVIAIIELDDPSHLDKVEQDRLRDQMLNEAGYRVLRYTEIPSIRQLSKDLSK
ncbi:very-short-patch-repair endonuclease [Acinetobacter baylyi]|uniref:Very-short-patch-repair endonuclease n=1 Tax=Acinetobacter baylyi TaxID=202950 RepID=A0ABU0UUG6_ACIBI|nr:very-short-patch-repair endonuclease [Acinetobacter baylyi]MDR6104987.1 very-short-patch-repair endonuclease [Acinetobacter baylyi]MDR6184806.1 very-short-patch-repair endonuclease [Acinetobacter baylyi]